jgi:DNA-binding NtrC family response regulator
MNGRLLLIDDEDVFREDIAALLRHEGYECHAASCGDEGVRIAEAAAPDVILCDMVMPGIAGAELVRRLAAVCPETPIVVITAHATVDATIDAFRAGAADYLLKPLLLDDLIIKIERSLEQRKLHAELRFLRRQVSQTGAGTTLVGTSRSVEAVRELIARVGPSNSSVLVTGESGTGKELVARALHDAGSSDRAPFIAVNCAALPHDLVESELFGHVRGAFTGAMRDKRGFFELANNGTLFLDEICELPTDLQPKLLRAIETQEIFPVGGTRQIRTNVRIVAATNRVLKTEIAEKRFRDDLYFRIAVVEIALPPLRERREDIPLLVGFLVARLNERLKRRVVSITNPALRVLMSAPWRGNVRELENVLERAMLLADGDVIGVEHFSSELAGLVEARDTSDDLRAAVRAYEREHIRHVLTTTGGNREEASRRLGIDASTLYRRMRELAI